MKPLIFCLVICTFCATCSFDQDESFRPESDGIFVLSGQQVYHLRVQGPSLFSGENVSDIAVDEEGLVWFASADKQTVSPARGGMLINTAPLTPHFIAMAPIHLMVVDSVRNQVGFFDRKKGDFIHQVALEQPGPVEVIVDKFYVLDRDSIIRVFLDQALVETSSISLPSPVQEVRLRGEEFLILLLEGEPLRAARIAYLTEALVEAPFSRRNLSPSLPCNWLDQRFPPSGQALFGTEWTHSVALCPDSIRSLGIAFGEAAESIAIDFFNSRGFYVKGDSLFGHDLKTNQPVGSWPWDGGKLGKALSNF